MSVIFIPGGNETVFVYSPRLFARPTDFCTLYDTARLCTRSNWYCGIELIHLAEVQQFYGAVNMVHLQVSLKQFKTMMLLTDRGLFHKMLIISPEYKIVNQNQYI